MNLYETDPEFMERFEHFAYDEVVNEKDQQLDNHIRYIAILATLIGCQGREAYREILPMALSADVTPVEIKEIVYQAADYLGFGRIFTFLKITNEVLTEKGIKLPLEGQATTTFENRLEKGIDAQAEIFGEQMREA